MNKKIFTYEQAVALLPEVQRLTATAVERAADVPDDDAEEAQHILTEWAEAMIALGLEVKGLWLVDFDSGGGYYCWHYPETSLEYFHGYEDGFGGRVKLN